MNAPLNQPTTDCRDCGVPAVVERLCARCYLKRGQFVPTRQPQPEARS